jgi:hypothetical protein
MLDALLGTGTSRHAFNAQTTGCSTKTEFVFLYLINALLSTILEPANLAIKVITLITEDVSSPQLNRSLM